jgi:hypothetical protein
MAWQPLYGPRDAVRAPLQMPRALRRSVLGLCTLLWGSGVAWLALHLFFEPRTEFGPLPHPWEPLLMRVHGLLAVVSVFLLGWLVAGHIVERWRRSRSRLSGWTLLVLAAVLIASGYALYYTVGPAHTASARVHEWLGAVSIIAALAHWLRIRASA